ADRFGKEYRRLQAEAFRSHDGFAGWVMNHIRDVPACRCGVMDDFGQWRFAAPETAYLSDRAFILETPGWSRCFNAGERAHAVLALSNFGPAHLNTDTIIRVESRHGFRNEQTVLFDVDRGRIGRAPFSLDAPSVDRPTSLSVTAVRLAAYNTWA